MNLVFLIMPFEFSMKFFYLCYSNVFEIYDSIPDPDVPKMRFVVNHAVNLCSALYISVGFLGYVAFVDKDFGGEYIPFHSLLCTCSLLFM